MRHKANKESGKQCHHSLCPSWNLAGYLVFIHLIFLIRQRTCQFILFLKKPTLQIKPMSPLTFTPSLGVTIVRTQGCRLLDNTCPFKETHQAEQGPGQSGMLPASLGKLWSHGEEGRLRTAGIRAGFQEEEAQAVLQEEEDSDDSKAAVFGTLNPLHLSTKAAGLIHHV